MKLTANQPRSRWVDVSDLPDIEVTFVEGGRGDLWVVSDNLSDLLAPNGARSSGIPLSLLEAQYAFTHGLTPEAVVTLLSHQWQYADFQWEVRAWVYELAAQNIPHQTLHLVDRTLRNDGSVIDAEGDEHLEA